MTEPIKRKLTVGDIQRLKESGDQITMVTAYDWSMARMLDDAGIDIVIVGDSVGMNYLGYKTTLPVTLDEMVHHTKAVARAVSRALLLGDLPFLSYEVSATDAVRAAGRLVKEAAAEAVKIEGGAEQIEAVKAIIKAKIPVMGHLGILPQSSLVKSGFRRLPGRTRNEIQNLLDDARALQDAGAFAILLECVPAEIAQRMHDSLEIPLIGLGSGANLDGQGMVHTDLLGLPSLLAIRPKFTKQYVNISEASVTALRLFVSEVKSKAFPEESNVYHLSEEQREALNTIDVGKKT